VQAVLAYQIGPQSREIAFGKQGETLEQAARDDGIEDRIAKELESLIVGRSEAAMRQRQLQQIVIPEGMPECLPARVPARGGKRSLLETAP